MKKRICLLLSLALMQIAQAQNASLVNTTNSAYAKLSSVEMGDVQWTKGFWAERFAICKDSMVPHLWQTYTNKKISHSFNNFEIAAGLDTGKFKGPSFHDGDFYKTFESVAALYASTKDPALLLLMDKAIAVIAKAQRADGYVYTKAIIEQQQSQSLKIFDDKLSFEAYNFGHLMTAACIHYRATGKTSLLEVAKKATEFLIQFYAQASPEQARNAICPSHYMGITEMYRTTGNKKYLDLVNYLINLRGTTAGTDDNSDRLPFRKMQEVNGHAVRANYLFAGVADVYAETGDTSLLHTLNVLWDDVVNRKIYITGGCGALYDGLSLEGISYKPDSIQRIQQAYGKSFQLPNLTAHNESCANIGNLLWNWRMLQLAGNAKYADVLEQTLYNSVLSGISLDGNKFFYTNPLAASQDYPYDLRWSGGREQYISKSNCCPPNLVRTIAEVSNYFYSIANEGLYFNLYGGNQLSTTLKDGSPISLSQTTNYPWDGNITVQIKQAPQKTISLFFRIPDWCKHAIITINGKLFAENISSGSYLPIARKWKTGDKIELVLNMPVELVTANPLIESTRNQVAVKRGPIVYCLESTDLSTKTPVFDVMIPANISFATTKININNAPVIALNAIAKLAAKTNWKNNLYQTLNNQTSAVQIKLIPYYAWANRGKSDMTVWMPLMR